MFCVESLIEIVNLWIFSEWKKKKKISLAPPDSYFAMEKKRKKKKETFALSIRLWKNVFVQK